MSESMIELAVSLDVAHVRFNKPSRGNALDRQAVVDLVSTLEGLPESVECIVFSGAGGRAFCGGADARELVDLPSAERREIGSNLGRASVMLWEHPALTIACIDGYASGGGAHIAMACDLRFMSNKSWIQFPSAKYGLNISVTWLINTIGPSRTFELMASARKVGSGEALQLGLSNGILASTSVEELLGNSRATDLRELKAAIRTAQAAESVADALAIEAQRLTDLIGGDRYLRTISMEPSSGRSKDSDV